MAKNKVFKERNKDALMEEMRDLITSLQEDQEIDHTEIRYLSEFISYKKLDEEYRYFRENAHEEQKEDLPFPYLTL